MHTVFRSEYIRRINDRLWQVQLTLTNGNDQQLIVLTDYFRKEVGGGTSWQRLGHLLLRME